MMTPEQAVFAAILLCIAGSLLTLLVSRNKTVAGWLAFGVTSVTAILIFAAGERVLVNGPSREAANFGPIPRLAITLRFHVDGLSEFFLMLAAFIAVLAALYSIGYMGHYRDYGVARFYPNFLLLLSGLYGLLSTTDMMWAVDDPAKLRAHSFRAQEQRERSRCPQISPDDGSGLHRDHDRRSDSGRARSSHRRCQIWF
jgi:hypothetical protein